MYIDTITLADIEGLDELTPPEWRDIRPSFLEYLNSSHCYPVKAVIEERIAGVGASICFGSTGWLAHIIVHPDFRNKGIGSAIVQYLIEDLEKKSCPSILLIATKLGEPVYRKVGFKPVTQYLFFKEGLVKEPPALPREIKIFSETYRQQLLNMDRAVSGEDREVKLSPNLDSARMYIDNKKLAGFYLPSLGEGLIVADNPEAGLALMNLKYSVQDRAVLPEENEAGVNFLIENGYKQTSTGLRMIRGKQIKWNPKKLYSRIGGHVG